MVFVLRMFAVHILALRMFRGFRSLTSVPRNGLISHIRTVVFPYFRCKGTIYFTTMQYKVVFIAYFSLFCKLYFTKTGRRLVSSTPCFL